jgi:hypothetical protein
MKSIFSRGNYEMKQPIIEKTPIISPSLTPNYKNELTGVRDIGNNNKKHISYTNKKILKKDTITEKRLDDLKNKLSKLKIKTNSSGAGNIKFDLFN